MTPEVARSEISAFTQEMATMLASGVLDPARLRQIEVRVSRLAKLGPAQDPTCAMILAMVAFALGKRIEAEQWVQAAVANPILVGKVVLLNAANVLASMGTNERAVQLLKIAQDRYPNDRNVLMFAYKIYDKAGLCFSAAQAFDKYADLIAPEHKLAAPQYHQHQNECRLAIQEGFAEADISARLSTAIDAVRNSGAEVLRQARQPLSDGSFIQHFYVDADVSRCADLNFDIADALSNEYEKTGVELFSVLCRPLAHYSVRNEVVSA